MKEKPTYRCAACGGRFEYGWTDAEAEAEYCEQFPDESGPREIICDGCYRSMGLPCSVN